MRRASHGPRGDLCVNAPRQRLTVHAWVEDSRGSRTRAMTGPPHYDSGRMVDVLAYFITLSAYGNRLHGDERGTVDAWHNEPGTPVRGPNAGLEAWEQQQIRGARMHFDAAARLAIEGSVARVCEYRGWLLLAQHCRTNHMRIVVSADVPIEQVTHDLKAYATREVRSRGLVHAAQPVWARSASMKLLTSEKAVASAVHYTLNAQGNDLPGTFAAATRGEFED